MKSPLAIKLMINGIATHAAIFPTADCQKTKPKEININKYKNGQTTPNKYGGGDNGGRL